MPERPPEPLRARAATPEPRSGGGGDRSTDTPAAPGEKSAAVPPWVWVAGVALALLGGAYVLSTQRDEALTQPQPEAPAASASAPALESNESAVPTDALSAAPAAPEPAARPDTEASPPASVAAPLAPTVEKPLAPKPAAPKVGRPVVVPAAPPAAVPAPAAPSPVTPPAPPKPADNPY